MKDSLIKIDGVDAHARTLSHTERHTQVDEAARHGAGYSSSLAFHRRRLFGGASVAYPCQYVFHGNKLDRVS